MAHSFHIPVLGLAFSIDTPFKVAKYGISSVVSLVDDHLIERIRLYYAAQTGVKASPISSKSVDARAQRITAYLDLMQETIEKQIEDMVQKDFGPQSDLHRYFEMLSVHDPDKRAYLAMCALPTGEAKSLLQAKLKHHIRPGRIDVNIMAKVDKANPAYWAEAMEGSSDALAALRGFANSKIEGGLVLSAGYNPRLYAYISQFDGFYPQDNKEPSKQIILKVSDYRSAMIQAKMLAKKGIWVSEFRVESGLNCGGHAFATDGYLMGPILEEFKQKRSELTQLLFESYKNACQEMGRPYLHAPRFRLSAQGGVGTADEHRYLLEYFELDSIGWGSPFLLVPEATTVDEATMQAIIKSEASDFYVSGSSPLGVPFNQFRKSTSETQRLKRIAEGNPGSPCTKKYLEMPTDVSDKPLCTASKAYIKKKLAVLDKAEMTVLEKEKAKLKIVEKACLCEGLATSAYLKYDLLAPKETKAVAICPGPNIQWFKSIYTLEEMVGHIYGRINLIDHHPRPHLFVNELYLYLDYLQAYIQEHARQLDSKKKQYIQKFSAQLEDGIVYYESLTLSQEERLSLSRHWNHARMRLQNLLKWVA